MRRVRRRCVRAAAALAASLVAALALGGCHSRSDSPEEQIRALIAKAEKAAEQGDVATLKDIISERYADPERGGKRAVVGVIGYYLLQHRSIHLLTQVHDIEFPEPGHAACTVFVGMAARPIQGVGELGTLHADIYRIEFTAMQEKVGDWKVTRADWRPAQLDDLAPE